VLSIFSDLFCKSHTQLIYVVTLYAAALAFGNDCALKPHYLVDVLVSSSFRSFREWHTETTGNQR
jgi:hypothetical protein